MPAYPKFHLYPTSQLIPLSKSYWHSGKSSDDCQPQEESEPTMKMRNHSTFGRFQATIQRSKCRRQKRGGFAGKNKSAWWAWCTWVWRSLTAQSHIPLGRLPQKIQAFPFILFAETCVQASTFHQQVTILRPVTLSFIFLWISQQKSSRTETAIVGQPNPNFANFSMSIDAECIQKFIQKHGSNGQVGE